MFFASCNGAKRFIMLVVIGMFFYPDGSISFSSHLYDISLDSSRIVTYPGNYTTIQNFVSSSTIQSFSFSFAYKYKSKIRTEATSTTGSGSGDGE